MDDALELAEYLPLNFKSPMEQTYVSLLWETFEENYSHGKYQFAFLAYHMLMMSFVYFNIWQIKKTWPEDFRKGLIGFNKETESKIQNGTSPFVFSSVNERSVFRFLKLIGCNHESIGRYAKFVEVRNNAAHANGNTFFENQNQLDEQIRDMLMAVREIQNQSHPVVLNCYEQFLNQSHHVDQRQYEDAGDQIREILIHSNYLSRKDIGVCLNYDILNLQDDHRESKVSLHVALREAFGSEP